MKLKALTLALGISIVALVSRAQTNDLDITNRYADRGTLFIIPMVSAPFPHPDRTNGHKYHDDFYTGPSNYSDSSVGFFIPKGFEPGATNDFVVHFHGWHNHVATVFTQYRLPEQFTESHRNAILIVPQGPREASDSFGGKLEDTNGFQRFMIEAVGRLNERGILHSTNIGNVIISGHSGGYHVMSRIVGNGGMNQNLREVWLFDALYGQTEYFTNWINNPQAHRLIDIYTLHGGTKEETETLMTNLTAEKIEFIAKKEADITDADLKKNKLIFIDSALEHNQVIYKHDEFRDYLQTSILKPIEIRTPKDSESK